MTVDFGGRAVSVDVDDGVLRSVFVSRFDGFEVDSDPSWSIRFEVVGETPEFLISPGEVYPEPVEILATQTGFSIVGSSYSADVDRGTQQVVIRGPRAAFPLDGVMRVLLPLLIDDGLVVHGGMLAERGRAWAFSGRSGAGKSTLARLLPEQACCDEMVALRRIDGVWRAFSLPFWIARPECAMLDAIYLLHHGVRNHRSRLSPAQATKSLMKEIMWSIADAGAIENCFEMLATLVSDIPVWDLHFRPTPDVWSVISETS